jgi:hypothetical protein
MRTPPTRRQAVTEEYGEGMGNGPAAFATFIVRVAQDRAGTVSGVVEWVRTGEKIRFHGLAAITEVIARVMECGRRT